MSVRDRVYGIAAGLGFGAAWVARRLAGATREERNERRGFLPAAEGPLFWFHGASAGEMAAALDCATLLREAGFRFVAGYTTTNHAGLELLRRRAGREDRIALGPWDAPRWVARAFERWNPRALFLVETELWPGLVLEAERRGVPVLCLSGRIYPRDLARYRAVRAWIGPTLARLAAVLARDEIERERFVSLGASPERCFVAGDLKHLRFRTAGRDGGPELARSLGIGGDEVVVVFGSLHRDEVATAFAALDSVADLPWRALIAPRQPSAAETVVRLAGRRGWPAARRSREAVPSGWRVLVLDTMGELASAYGLAAVAVVGGGFGRHGGHNLLEAPAAGAPVLFGPYFEHFEADARRLVRAVPEARVSDAVLLGMRLREWISDPTRRDAALAAQRAVLPDGVAVGHRYLAILSRCLANP